MKKTKLVSDIRIALEKGFKENGHLRKAKIRIDFDGDKIFVRGTVRTYYQKQMVLSVMKQVGVLSTIAEDIIVE